ncbi:MAG: hypothetical protein OEQ74_05015 [Gammaproteobacteria bacterium]|nr:hypothetical protein [Gammaproteobacteria bacterium]
MNWTAKLEEDLFDDAETEHITISSETSEEDVAPATPRKTNRRFSQSGKTPDGTRSFTIFDERFLAVRIEHPRSGDTEYQFNLAFLDPTPGRYSGVAWRWLYATLALAGAAIAGFRISLVSGIPLLDQRWLPVSVLLAAMTIVALLVFIHRTSFTLTFRSLHGRAPLVEMAARCPTRSAVESFVLELQQHIEAARTATWEDKPQFLRDELRVHYRLWEEGALAEEIYEAGKVRILAQHG